MNKDLYNLVHQSAEFLFEARNSAYDNQSAETKKAVQAYWGSPEGKKELEDIAVTKKRAERAKVEFLKQIIAANKAFLLAHKDGFVFSYGEKVLGQRLTKKSVNEKYFNLPLLKYYLLWVQDNTKTVAAWRKTAQGIGGYSWEKPFLDDKTSFTAKNKKMEIEMLDDTPGAWSVKVTFK